MQSFIKSIFFSMLGRMSSKDDLFAEEIPEQIALEATFSESQKKLFKQYSDACVVRIADDEEAFYRRGFKTGVLLMLEVLKSDLQL